MINYTLHKDPTRTITLRRSFSIDMNKRFLWLATQIKKLVIEDDIFGLSSSKLFEPLNMLAEYQQWRFRTDAGKIKEFRKWLQQQVNAGVLEVDGMGKPWTNKYVTSAYKRGMIRAYIDTHYEVTADKLDFYLGSREQFLRSSFSTIETINKLELLYTRTFEELRGVTDAMAQQMSRILADGLAHGKGVETIARNLTTSIGKLNRTRARVITRTEIIRAYAEGQLDSFELLGVEEVGIMAEWLTAGDNRVCLFCGSMEGQVMSIDEARGMIPLHANCRCCWIPYIENYGLKKKTG